MTEHFIDAITLTFLGVTLVICIGILVFLVIDYITEERK